MTRRRAFGRGMASTSDTPARGGGRGVERHPEEEALRALRQHLPRPALPPAHPDPQRLARLDPQHRPRVLVPAAGQEGRPVVADLVGGEQEEVHGAAAVRVHGVGAARVEDAVEQDGHRQVGADVERVAVGRAGRDGRADRRALAVAQLERHAPVREDGLVGVPVHLEPVLDARAGAPTSRRAPSRRSTKKPSRSALLPPGLERAEEARLLEVRPAVLGAERVAVAAVVAEVLEGRDLVALAHLEAAARDGDGPAALDAVALVLPRERLDLVDEVGVVRAGGQALVAVDAVEEGEVPADPARRAERLRPGTAGRPSRARPRPSRRVEARPRPRTPPTVRTPRPRMRSSRFSRYFGSRP